MLLHYTLAIHSTTKTSEMVDTSYSYCVCRGTELKLDKPRIECYEMHQMLYNTPVYEIHYKDMLFVPFFTYLRHFCHFYCQSPHPPKYSWLNSAPAHECQGWTYCLCDITLPSTVQKQNYTLRKKIWIWIFSIFLNSIRFNVNTIIHCLYCCVEFIDIDRHGWRPLTHRFVDWL